MSAISLITPTRNRDRMLLELYESITNQSFIDWRWIVVVDGEDGLSAEVAQKLSQHPQIKVYFIPKVGTTKSVAFGVEVSDSQYIGIVDDDDWLHPNCLATVWDYVRLNPNCDLVYTKYFEAINGSFFKGRRSFIEYSPERLLMDFMVFHFRLIERQALQAIGGINQDYAYAYDYDLCLRMSEYGTIQHLPEYLYYYRHHHPRISTEKRLGQIYYAGLAVNEALERRGLSDRYYLDVKVQTTLTLKG